MKKLVMFLMTLCIIVYSFGCKSTKKPEESKALSVKPSEVKIYNIPKELQKESYSVEEFKGFYSEYLNLNNITEETSLENDRTGMSKEEQLKYYTIWDITPKEVKEEIGCQIFKINYTCETYVVYKAKVFHIGFGFGGFGVTSLTTCDFDENGQKDLIYTFSWGSGLHRSHIGIFNLSKEKEEWLDFVHENKDIMIEKVSDNKFNIYDAELSSKGESSFVNFNIIKQEHIADVQIKDGKTEVVSIG